MSFLICCENVTHPEFIKNYTTKKGEEKVKSKNVFPDGGKYIVINFTSKQYAPLEDLILENDDHVKMNFLPLIKDDLLTVQYDPEKIKFFEVHDEFGYNEFTLQNGFVF